MGVGCCSGACRVPAAVPWASAPATTPGNLSGATAFGGLVHIMCLLPGLTFRVGARRIRDTRSYSRIPSSLLNSSSAFIIVSTSGTIGASVAAAITRTDSFVNGDTRIVRITS